MNAANPGHELPDLFRCENGARVRTAADWRRRRAELQDLILAIEYGRLPRIPAATEGEELHSHKVPRFLNASHTQYRLITGPDPAYRFVLRVLVPPGDGPFPVILNGDACWRYVTDEITLAVLQRGYILAEFNRTEIVPDNGRSERTTGLYRACPDGDYGALAAWAWGYHRCMDFLLTLPCVDADRIAAAGHSRGGKTVLLAGATDERIALTAPNNSGACGAGCFRRQGPGSETLGDSIRGFPYWFGPRLKEFDGKEDSLPFDQHSLKALVAPRALLTTEALGDLWANPSGTWQTHLAAREAYRFLGAEERIGIWYRPGPHCHGAEDWAALLDFADWHFRGLKPARRFNESPFAADPPAFSWSAPRLT